MWGVILALQSSCAVHLGVDNLGVVRHVGRLLDGHHVVRLGGQKVKKARRNAADAVDADDVFLYLDSSIAPLLDMRRRFKAFMGVLGAMVQSGVTKPLSVELTAQWDRILAAGPLYSVTLDDLSAVRGLGIHDFHRVVSDVNHRLSDFIQCGCGSPSG